MTCDHSGNLSVNSFVSPIKIGKVWTIMLCALIFVAVFVVAVPTNVGAADPVTIYVDTFWIDERADLTPEQREQLKECIIHDIQLNFNLAVGAGKVEVTNDPAKKDGSDRQVLFLRTVGTHINKQDGTTGYHYGIWFNGDTEVRVYLGTFMDLTAGAQDPNDYKTDGQWDITKLNNAIGQTCAHELGHSFCIGHNGETEPEDQSKMTDGGLVPSSVKANNAWMFDEHSERVLAENLNKKPCKSAVDYDEVALWAHFWGAPDLPGVPDEWGAVNTLFSFSGSHASEFELGWYGVDTDDGVIDGSSEFDFIYKTSMLPDPEQNAEMLTFFEGITDKVQFLLRGAPGSPWEGQWFSLGDENVVLEDFVETPNGDVVARKVSMGWDVDGEPGLDVQITLDAANAFGVHSNPYNGFLYEYVSPGDVAVIDVIPSKTVIGQGYSTSISVTATNQGGLTETFSVTVYANTTEIETREITLSSGHSTTITFIWNTSGFAKGYHTISAYAWPVPGETDTADNNCPGGWILVAMVGDLGGRVPPAFFNCDGKVDGKDLALFLKCFKGLGP